jgi:2-polyprenyl-3-methyl-5-hydroxy-6-metoxy-1,4-benzoquinol methylase
MKFEEKWKIKFSESAKKEGEDYQISLWTKEGLEEYIKYFCEYFTPYIKEDNSQIKILDLGCGPGTFSNLLDKKGFEVYGVDYSPSMIEIAKQRTINQKINFQVANIYSLPFEKHFFDIVICFGIFQHLEKPKEAIQEIKRVLKKKGLAIITTLNKFSLPSFFKKEKNRLPLERYSPYFFKKILFLGEFYEIKLKGIYFIPFNLFNNFVLKFKIYNFLNLFFPFFMFFSHSFYIEGKKLE